MGRPLRALLVEDLEDDATLLLRMLRKGGYEVESERVETAAAMSDRLDARHWDIVIADYSMPSFNAPAALALLKAKGLDIPFLIVSRNVGEDLAVDAMRAGANDYIMKGNLARLVPAVERELREAAGRSERRKAESALKESEKRFRSLIEHSSDLVMVLDGSGLIRYASPSTRRILGYEPEQLIGKSSAIFANPEDLSRLGAMLDSPESGGGQSLPLEVHFRHADGRARVLEMTASNRLADPDVGGLVINSRDITDRKRDEETIHNLAYFDALTGLPNRRLFRDRLSQALSHAHRIRENLGIIYLDLDRFKTINDSLGHASGDRLLRGVAERLSGALRIDDTVARLGGDEFVILLPSVGSIEDAARIAQKLQDAFGRPFQLDEHELSITASFGVSLFPADGEDIETLLKNADTAMYRAKERGRNNYQLYAPAMNAKAFQRLVLENSFRRALEREEFVLHYQPQVNATTGQIVGMEALVRWQHPELGLVHPAEFIPLAEETGLIAPLEDWVLRTACAQNVLWRAAGNPSLRVAVNLSVRHLKAQDFYRTIARTLEETGLPGRYLELEVTESIVMDNVEATIATLSKLKELGIQISIDDFGTGYSSISYLKRLPIDRLKIDPSFMRDIPSDSDDVAIVQLIIAIAHSLKLQIIAEGVESEEQVRFLCTHFCDEMQGFLFSKPVDAETLTGLLKSGGRIRAPLRVTHK